MPEYRILFKKTSSQKRSNSLWAASKVMEQYISRYQDEVGKETENTRRGRSPETEGPETSKTPQKKSKKKKTPWKSPLTHNTGVLWAGGFFGNMRSPGKKKPRNQKKWIKDFVKEWNFKARGMTRRKNEGTRMVLAISDKMVDELTSCGIPADLATQEILAKGMGLYAKRHGWEPSELGWLAGFHHDNDHLHIHVLLFPTTTKGEPLRLSNRNEKGGEIRDDLTDLTGAMNVAAEIYYQNYLPYRIQSPETKLAWFKDIQAPIPKIEDYRVENPLPSKYMDAEEREEIRKKRKEIDNSRERAKQALAIEISKDPQKEKELQTGTPLKITKKDTVLDKLIRLWVREQAKSDYIEATREEEPDIRPNSKDPKKAKRAILLLETQMPMAKLQIERIEEEIENTIQNLEDQMEENRKRGKGIKGILKIIKGTWNNARLGHLRWRLNKGLEKIRHPEERSRILANLHMATLLNNQGNALINTEAGLEDLKSFVRNQTLLFQRQSQSIVKNFKEPEEQGEALRKSLQTIQDSLGKIKKEMAWVLSLKGALTKISAEKTPSHEISLLTQGARLRLKTTADEKEIRRARIKLQKNKKPLPAKTSQTAPPTKEGRQETPGENLFRLPKFLQPKIIVPILDSKMQEIHEKPAEQNLEREESQEKSQENPLQGKKWQAPETKTTLQTILLELQRRRSKNKDQPQ